MAEARPNAIRFSMSKGRPPKTTSESQFPILSFILKGSGKPKDESLKASASFIHRRLEECKRKSPHVTLVRFEYWKSETSSRIVKAREF